MVGNKELMEEIQKIKIMLTAINLNLKRLLTQYDESSGQILLSHIHNDYVNAIGNYVASDLKERLEAKLPPSCGKREACKNVIGDFLHKNLRLIRQLRVNDDDVREMRREFDELKRNNAANVECLQCFKEAELLFERQIQLFRSLNIYSDDKSESVDLSKIPENVIVNEIFEPLANVKRFQILKALAIKERTFSDMIQLTGLQGGNLLFHLQKLLDAGLIIQRHERGDYMVTEKGYKILKGILGICRDLPDLNIVMFKA
ncbi:MAG: winged helix-turn-helix domain-containing protein [Candidatus Bathyarchaeota archaeon]|nr:winged helix-turn-helix domain-containing protein [Candidatus Bathyarchaeota archaeon]MCX8177245.1 winged helix-turn-helix domain-containing protein [Candidatus Bathyarchaeota archaeon]MDW8193512.1 winged helix-turn-helix domain-containing protein [Nitrososphaerota archaeon]